MLQECCLDELHEICGVSSEPGRLQLQRPASLAHPQRPFKQLNHGSKEKLMLMPKVGKGIYFCCRIALVLEYFQLEKREPVKKNGTDKCNSETNKNDKCKQTNANEKCKFEKGKHHNCKKNGIEKCKFQKGEANNCKTNALNNVSLREATVANEDNLERGTGDKWRTIGKNKEQNHTTQLKKNIGVLTVTPRSHDRKGAHHHHDHTCDHDIKDDAGTYRIHAHTNKQLCYVLSVVLFSCVAETNLTR